MAVSERLMMNTFFSNTSIGSFRNIWPKSDPRRVQVSCKHLKERDLQQKQPSRSVLKICSKFTGEHPYRSAISIKLLHLFLRTDLYSCFWTSVKGAISGLIHFSAAKTPLKMMKNSFYFTKKVLFFLKLFKFLSWLFGHVAKQLDKKDKVNFKFYDVTAWLTNYCNTHIAQYLEK